MRAIIVLSFGILAFCVLELNGSVVEDTSEVWLYPKGDPYPTLHSVAKKKCGPFMIWDVITDRKNGQLGCFCLMGYARLVQNYREILPECVSCMEKKGSCEIKDYNVCVKMKQPKYAHYKKDELGFCI